MTGTSKGAQTKARILTAAATLFSEQSFDSVTVRAIARTAHVDPALINHYFGSKEGLFAALLEQHIQPDTVEQALFSTTNPTEWGSEFVRLAERVWASPTGAVMLAVIRRAFASNTDMLHDFATSVIVERIASHLTGEDDERQLRASLAASQMVGFLMARYVLKVQPLAELSTEDACALIGPTIQRYLTGPLPPGA